MAKRKYYLAKGDDEKIVRDFFNQRAEANARAREVANKYGGAAVSGPYGMVGLAFDGQVPDGWRKVGDLPDTGQPYYLPHAKSKWGKAAKSEILSVVIPGTRDLHSRFSQDGGVMGDMGPSGGFYIHFITAEIVDGKCIIHVPEQMDFAPPAQHAPQAV